MAKVVGRALITVMALWVTLAASQAAERVALVVGNSAYTHAAVLKNPRGDAEAMAVVLGRLGFEVVKGVDLDDGALKKTIGSFISKLKADDVALFFFAGHGLQVDGRNYLLPINARLSDRASLESEAIRLEVILGPMGAAKRTSIVLLDASRNNPLAQKPGKPTAPPGRGIELGVDTFVGFATQPGNVAIDGPDANSPFTAALLKHIETPGLDIEKLMRNVRDDVLAATGGKQVPWSSSSLAGGFVFKAKGAL